MKVIRENRILEKMLNYSLDMICTIDSSGCFVHVSEACKSILGYESEELTGRAYIDFVHTIDKDRTLQAVDSVSAGSKTTDFENHYIHRQGHKVPLMWSSVWSEEEKLLFCVAREGTEQKLARKKLREKDEWYQALMEHGSDMLSLLSKEGKYIYVSKSVENLLGYTPEQLIGKSPFSLLHPEDISTVHSSFLSALNSQEQIKTSEFRFKNSNGEWRWVETVGNNQLHNPNIQALVVSSRDVTDRVLNRRKLQESEQRFKALFEANPDMIIFEDKEGTIVDVNPATLSVFGLKKEEVVNLPLSQFLPAAAVPVCTESLNNALQGEQVSFELKIDFEDIGQRILDITKIPVSINNQTVGVYTIAKDVTEVSASHKIIKDQAKKLSTIFESITDAFFTLDQNWHITYCNTEFGRLLQLNVQDSIGKELWQVFPEEVGGEFYQQYHLAVKTGKAVHFESYLARVNMWLQVKAYPSEEGLSVYFDDITDKVKGKAELEKLSLVASKTTNGVMILDANGVTEWVNEGFTNITGYTFSEAVGKRPRAILSGEETDPDTKIRIDAKMKKVIPFKEEILNYKKSGEKVWLSLDITPVLNDAGEVSRFINIQTDITFRKEVEASQLELTRDLFRQNKDLQQFTYIVSHNLRSPVANAIGLAEILTTADKDSALYEESLVYLKSSIFKLDNVLRDLNVILSIRDRKDTLEKERVNLLAKCQEVVDNLQEPLQNCGAEVVLKIGEEAEVYSDKAYLYSIFYNLLSNAIKYRSKERPLKVTIKCFGSTEKGSIISVSDNGSGFDLEKAGGNVFGLYKRFHSHSEGRGIGLFLVKTHLEAMGGHIEVSSQVNVGTRFLIYLK